jgi:hypothetical protein
MITDFETFYNDLTSDEIWFESIKMTHPHKDYPLAAKQIYTSYLADKFIPDMKEVRKHLNNKLIYQLPKKERLETNYQHEKKEDDFSNPLTDEQKKEVDKWLNAYLEEIRTIEMKSIPKISHKEAVEEGQWLPKKKEPYRPDHLYGHMQLAIKEARKQLYKTRFTNLSALDNYSMYMIDEYEIFAASAADAEAIYNGACEILIQQAEKNKSINE